MPGKADVKERYFQWLCNFVYDPGGPEEPHYNSLLLYLFEHDFVSKVEMDVNREVDGLDLRKRYFEEHESDKEAGSQTIHPLCSFLEMMIALCLKCEEEIMTDDAEGDRTGQWFWEMIVSLGLGGMSDENFDEEKVDHIMDRFVNRKYEKNGKGGLFTVNGREEDMRKVDIWYQMEWHLTEILG